MGTIVITAGPELSADLIQRLDIALDVDRQEVVGRTTTLHVDFVNLSAPDPEVVVMEAWADLRAAYPDEDMKVQLVERSGRLLLELEEGDSD